MKRFIRRLLFGKCKCYIIDSSPDYEAYKRKQGQERLLNALRDISISEYQVADDGKLEHKRLNGLGMDYVWESRNGTLIFGHNE